MKKFTFTLLLILLSVIGISQITTNISLPWGSPLPSFPDNHPTTNDPSTLNYTYSHTETSPSETLEIFNAAPYDIYVENYPHTSSIPRNNTSHLNFKSTTRYNAVRRYRVTLTKLIQRYFSNPPVTKYGDPFSHIETIIYTIGSRRLTGSSAYLTKVKGKNTYCKGAITDDDEVIFEVTMDDITKNLVNGYKDLDIKYTINSGSSHTDIDFDANKYQFTVDHTTLKSYTNDIVIQPYIVAGTYKQAGYEDLVVPNKVYLTPYTIKIASPPSAPTFSLKKSCGTALSNISISSPVNSGLSYYGKNMHILGGALIIGDLNSGSYSYHSEYSQIYGNRGLMIGGGFSSDYFYKAKTNEESYIKTVNSDGCERIDIIPKLNIPNPAVTLPTNLITPVLCEGVEGTVQIKNTDNNVEYELNSISKRGNKGTLYFDKMNIGSHRLIKTSYDGLNLSNCKITEIVTINSYPKVNLSVPNLTRCGPGEIIITAPDHPNYKYSWSQKERNIFIPIIKEKKNILNITISETTDFLLEIIDENGCVHYDTVTATIRDLPTFTLTDSIICEDVSKIDLDNLVTTQTVGTWTDPNNLTNSNNEFLVSSATVGDYSFSYSETNGFGCEKVDSLTITISAIPVPNFVGTDTICIGTLVNLNDYVDLKTGTWSDASNTPISNNEFTPTAESDVEFNHKLVSADGCVSNEIKVLSLHIPKDPIAGITNTDFCKETPTTPIVLNATGGVSYTWEKQSSTNTWGIVNTTIDSITDMLTSSNNYRVTAINQYSCVSSPLTVMATIRDLPTFTLTDGNMCSYDSVLYLDDLITNQNGGTFTGNGIYGNSFLKHLITDTIILVSYYETNSFGCEKTDTSNIYIHTPTEINWLPIPTLCNNNISFSLDDYVTPRFGVFDSKPYINSLGVFKAKDLQAGNYNINYTYVDNNNCKTISTYDVEVEEKYVEEININDTTICYGDTVNLSIKLFDINLDYQWYNIDSTKVNEGYNYQTEIKEDTKFFIFAEDGCITHSKEINVLISDLEGDFWSNTNEVESNNVILFETNIGSSANNYQYYWEFHEENGLPYSYHQNPGYVYHSPMGYFDVTLTVTSPQNCEKVINKEDYIRVNDTYGYFTFNDSLTNDFYGSRVWYANPIPVDDNFILHFESSSDEDVTISIFDFQSRTIYHDTHILYEGENLVTINRNLLPSHFIIFFHWSHTNDTKAYQVRKGM